MQVHPYLTFNGQCEAAFKFYAECFGGNITAMMTHEAVPAGFPVPPEWRSKILHARMTIGDTELMASDAPPDRYEAPQGFSVSLMVPDIETAERTFRALAADGTIRMPIDKTFFAARFGMLVDRFGIPWMVVCEQPA